MAANRDVKHARQRIIFLTQIQRDGMLRLIETELTSAGKFDFGDRSPSLFVYFGTRHAFFLQRGYLGVEIVTH